MRTPKQVLSRCGLAGRGLKRRERGGFTLVEMLIAVAAVGLIAVGLGKLFEKTGETVRIGRRVSNLNETAAMMERTMREDFSRMSRNGFLVIRNRLVGPKVGTPLAVGLTKDDLSPRERRVDEVLFFREGRFGSKRDPVNPARYPIGSAARIYIGHGLPQLLTPNAVAYVPEINDSNSGPDPSAGISGVVAAPSFGEDGPSKYASKWILLRHETVLSPPLLTSKGQGNGAPAGVVDPRLNGKWTDNRIQVGLQPAAADIFRVIAENYNGPLPNPGALVRGQPISNQTVLLPRFESGIVDVAATDLSQIRARVLNAQPLDQNYLKQIRDDQGQAAPFSLERLNISVGPSTDPYQRQALGVGESVAFVTQDPVRISDPVTTTNPQSIPTAARMKAWMIQALPAGPKPLNDPDPERERRMRCEAAPPDLNGVVTGTQVYGTNGGASGNEAFRRTDQAMLSASNFVVGCTEFIVEWSFGERYPSDTNDPRTNPVPQALRGQLIWHGLPRLGDVNGDGDINNDEYVAHPYNSDEPSMIRLGLPTQTQQFNGFSVREPLVTIGSPPFTQEQLDNRPFIRTSGYGTARHVFQTGLIHEPAPQPGEWGYPGQTQFDLNELYSCFGYVDPTFGYIAPRGQGPRPTYGDPGNNGAQPLTPRPGEPQSVSVPWPKLVRVTISLVEASEPLKEQTYQFIFELPKEGDQLPGT